MINICFNLFLVLIHIFGEGKYLFQFDPFRRWCTPPADDKIICLQELCGRDPTFLPLQAKALGGNPSYVLLAFFVFIVVFVSVAPFVLFLPTICAPHLICLWCCFCLCCSLCFVFSNPMCSSPSLSFVFFCIYLCAPQLSSKSSRLEKILRGF